MRAALLALLTLLAACAETLPRERAGAALFRDLQRLVSLRATRGWQIDRIAIDSLEADALDSTCRVPLETREALLAWTDAELRRHGGPIEDVYRERGKELDGLDELLELTRIRMLLARAMADAANDCPFWIDPDPGFRGLQVADDRWQLVIEGGGRFIIARQQDRTDYSAGGAGRFLLGHTWGRHLGLYTGFELTGSAELPREGEGENRNRGVVFALDVVTPLVVRWRFVNSYLELGAGPLGHWSEDEDGLIPGVHASAALGFRALRERFFVPGLAITAAYERTFPDGGKPALALVKFGLRLTLEFDL